MFWEKLTHQRTHQLFKNEVETYKNIRLQTVKNLEHVKKITRLAKLDNQPRVTSFTKIDELE